MELALGIWKHEIVFMFDDTSAERLGRLGWQRGVELCLIDTILVLAPNEKGTCLGLNCRQHSEKYRWLLNFGAAENHNDRHQEYLVMLPFCSLTDLEADIDSSGMMELELPMVHELSWPGIYFKLSQEQWIDTIEERLRSSMAVGIKRLNAPKHVRRMSGLWAEALKRIQGETV